MGALVILVALTLEPLVGCVQRRWGKTRGQYARLEWTATETLQLQRLAHEELGYGGEWRGAASAVPVTAPGEVLGVLDMGDVGHPRLVGRVMGEGEDGEMEEENGEMEEEKEGAVRVDGEARLGSSFSGVSGETLGREGGGSSESVATRDV